MKMYIDRHGPRLMPHNCQHLDSPNFLLPTTFNSKFLNDMLCREYGDEGVEADTHSTIRRQSVIIEGLTMETDELRV
jgi:hypothetical protein